jgi:hypothetical protein
VFLVAGAISVVAFALTWLLREVPLQGRSSPQVGDAIPAPGDEHSRVRATA